MVCVSVQQKELKGNKGIVVKFNWYSFRRMLGRVPALVWKPYLYWQRPEGIRETLAVVGKKVWMFGGSAVWGTGVEWSETIPSYLATLGYKVTNYGERGYVSTQELFLLILELRKGTPGIVIFYNGYNDVFSGHQQGIAGLPLNEFNRVKEFNLAKGGIMSLLHAKLKRERKHFPAAFVKVKKIRDNNIEVARVLGKSLGFQVYDFWQPERHFGDYTPSFKVPDECFIDKVHLTKEGNEIIANGIYEAVS